MQTLTHGFLTEIYEKCNRHFLSGIDPQLHATAYIGEHAGIAFAESEFAGKYMDICVRLYRYTGDALHLQHAVQVAQSAVDNQRADGYIGGYERGREWNNFSVWNQAFTMIGLLSVWEASGEEIFFAAAERCAAYIAHHFLDSRDDDILNAVNNGSQHLAVLVPMAMLYAKTEKPIYRNFFEYVFDRMRHSDNNFVEFSGIFALRSKKAIENFCCLIGMEMYSAMTDNTAIHEAVKGYWREVGETQIRETGNGSIKELWTENGNAPAFLPIEERPNETCVAVGWAELNGLLFRREQQARCLDEIERTLFNHILGSLDADCTDLAYYQPNFGKRITRTAQDMYKCCRYRGFSAIACIPEHLFWETDGTVIPMIYTNALFESEHICIREETEYPFEGKIRFTVKGEGTLRLRIPAWCGCHTVTQNGKELTSPCRDGFVDLSGAWQGDEIVLDLHTEQRYKKAVIDGEGHVGITYGSVVCVLLGRKTDEVLQARLDASRAPQQRERGQYRLHFFADGSQSGSPETLEIADYASAGKANRDEEYTVWIKEAKD